MVKYVVVAASLVTLFKLCINKVDNESTAYCFCKPIIISYITVYVYSAIAVKYLRSQIACLATLNALL